MIMSCVDLRDALMRLFVFCCISEDFISQSAAGDGDVDRIERMHVCEKLWKECSDKIQVNLDTLLLEHVLHPVKCMALDRL